MTNETVCSKTTLRLNYEESSNERNVTASLRVPKFENKHFSFFTAIRTLYEYVSFIVLIIFPQTRKWTTAKILQRERIKIKQHRQSHTDERNWEVERDDSTADISRTNMKVHYRKQIQATSTQNYQKMQVIDLQILKEHIRSEDDELEDQRNNELMAEKDRLNMENRHLQQINDELTTENEGLNRQNRHLQQILQKKRKVQEKLNDKLEDLQMDQEFLQLRLEREKHRHMEAIRKINQLKGIDHETTEKSED